MGFLIMGSTIYTWNRPGHKLRACFLCLWAYEFTCFRGLRFFIPCNFEVLQIHPQISFFYLLYRPVIILLPLSPPLWPSYHHLFFLHHRRLTTTVSLSSFFFTVIIKKYFTREKYISAQILKDIIHVKHLPRKHFTLSKTNRC